MSYNEPNSAILFIYKFLYDDLPHTLPAVQAHFILFLDKKNEARKIKPKRPPTRSAAMQEFQAKRASLLA